MRRFIRNLGLSMIVCLLVSVPPPSALAAPAPAVNVLFLSSWFRDLPWQQAVERGLTREITAQQLPVNLYVEYIDGGRFPLSDTAENLYQLFKAKYGNIRLDLVISEGIPAAMMMQKSAALFPDARKLIIQNSVPRTHDDDQRLWRMTLQQNYAQAIAAMIKVCDPERIAVVADIANAYGRKRLANFKQGLATVDLGLPVTYLTGPTLADIIRQTAELPPQTAIFYLLYFHDDQDQRLTPFEAVQRIAATANAPIFSHWATLMGSGIVGGYLLSGEKEGEKIAQAIAVFIENRAGNATAVFDPEKDSLFEYQYDWRQLERWHIDKRQLPEQARILFRDPGILEAYPLETTVLISFIAILATLSAALVFETRRRKKFSEQLRVNQEHLNAIFKANPDPVVVFDAEGRVLYLNPEFKQQFGWETAQLHGWQFPFVAQNDRNNINAMIEAVVSQKGPLRVQIEGLSRLGNSMHMIASAAKVHGTGNENAGVVVNLTDISKQKELEDQLRQIQKMEAIGRLAGGVAHDFNNMLSVIVGYSQLAMSRIETTDPTYSSLQEILKAANHSAKLTQQLLGFARKQAISPVVFDLNETVESMLKMLERMIGEEIDLRWIPGPTCRPIKMDPSQLDQILTNLCVNARDAIAGVGKITIETGHATFNDAYCAHHSGFTPGDFVLLAVSDDGCGMDKKTQDKIFEPFFTTKEINKGTGLGLAMVYGIVKQNNGFINVYSEPGNGTTIKIYFAAHAGETTKINIETVPEYPLGRGETILLVDDEQALMTLGGKMLDELGYRVLTANTPGEALRIVHEDTRPIHLLVTDVVMPEMNGRDLAERLSKHHPDLKVLYMSGYSTNVIAHRGVLDEGVNFIQKPIRIELLASKVRTALDLPGGNKAPAETKK